MTQEYTKWKLTDQEIDEVEARGGDIAKAQELKKQAYIEAGGIILNPDALPRLYEACRLGLKIAEEYIHGEYDGTTLLGDLLEELEPIREAIAAVEGK